MSEEPLLLGKGNFRWSQLSLVDPLQLNGGMKLPLSDRPGRGLYPSF
jgi:hypothetical protein